MLYIFMFMFTGTYIYICSKLCPQNSAHRVPPFKVVQRHRKWLAQTLTTVIHVIHSSCGSVSHCFRN